MAGMKISELDFLRLLPVFMRDDEAVIALSNAMNKLMGEPGARLHTIRTWDKIDELSESECDELAWELDIDWYDSTGMNLAEKRETIKYAQQIKRKRGTKWAVERLISTYFGEGFVTEWYEMENILTTPYTFVVMTTNTQVSDENYQLFIDAANAAKNERSHIAGIFYYWQQDPAIEYAPETSLHRYDFKPCGTDPRQATLGFIVKHSIEIKPDETAHTYGFTAAGELPCGTYPQSATVGAVLKAARVAVELEEEHTTYGFTECGADGLSANPGAPIVGTAIVGKAVLVH